MSSQDSAAQACLHSSVSSPPSPEHEPLARLLRWAAARGAVAPKLALDPADPRRFLAAAPISPLEPIIILPQQLLMHAGTALSDPVYGPAFRALRAEMAPTARAAAAPQSTSTGGVGAGAAPSPGGAVVSGSVPHSYWDAGGLSDRELLCMALIVERARGPQSAWAPYIDILPPTYDDPAWWAAPSLELLRGTRLARAVAAYTPGLSRLAAAMRRLAEIHAGLRREAEGEGEAEGVAKEAGGEGGDRSPVPDPLLSGWPCSLEAARWARSAVWSRSFTVRGLVRGGGGSGGGWGDDVPGPGTELTAAEAEAGEGAGEGAAGMGRRREPERRLEVCQVPVLDMIDHSEGCSAVWHTGPEGRDEFVWMRREAVQQGSVLCNHYGSKDNQELLLAYGFAIWPNTREYVTMSIASGRGRAGARGGGLGGGGPGGGGGCAADLSGEAMQLEGAGAVEAVEGVEDGEGLQSAAEAVQRLLVAAAAGLPGELRLTLEEPLPEQLMQATRVALSSGPRLYFAASDALTLNTPAVAVAVAPSADPTTLGPPASARSNALMELLQPYDTVSELRVLGTLVRELEGRLAAMVSSDQEVYDILGLEPQQQQQQRSPGPEPGTSDRCGPPAPSGSPQPQPLPRPQLLLPTDWMTAGREGGSDSGSGGGSGGASPGPGVASASAGGSALAADGHGHGHGRDAPPPPSAPPSAPPSMSPSPSPAVAALSRWGATQAAAAQQLGVGLHSRLALAVVNGQRAVLTAALRAARERMGALIQHLPSGGSSSGSGSGWGDEAPLELLMLPRGVRTERARGEPAAAGSGARAGGRANASGRPLEASGCSGGASGCGSAPPPPPPPPPPAPLPITAAVRTRRSVEAGEALMRLPLHHCLLATTADQLTARLVLLGAGEALRTPLQMRPSGCGSGSDSAPTPVQAQTQQQMRGEEVSVRAGKAAAPPSPAPHGPGPLLRQLLRHVAPQPAVRLMMPTPVEVDVDGDGDGDGDGGATGRPQGGAGAASRDGGWWGGRCLALLEGTPAGSEYEAAAVELQDDFNAFRRRLPSLAASLSTSNPTPTSAPTSMSSGPMHPSGTSPASSSPLVEVGAESEVSPAVSVGSFLSAPPRAAFWLYCWAREVVERCSVELELEGEMGEGEMGEEGKGAAGGEKEGGRRQRQRQRIRLVAPLLWALPQELVASALRLEWLSSSPGSTRPWSPSEPTPGAGAGVLVVNAACPLPSGLLLHPACLLPGSREADAVMARYGPEPLAPATRLLQVQAPVQVQVPVANPQGDVWADVAAAAAAAAADGEGGPTSPGGTGGCVPLCCPAHGLELLPADDDPGRELKLALAGRLGLGSQHYLGPAGRGARLATAALLLMLLPAEQGQERERRRERGHSMGSRKGKAAATTAAGGEAWAELQRLAEAVAVVPGRLGGPDADADADVDADPAGTSAGAGSPDAASVGAVGGPRAPGSAQLEAEAEGAALLATARRAVSLLGDLPTGSATAKAARKLLRRELTEATKRLAAREGQEEEEEMEEMEVDMEAQPELGADAEAEGGRPRGVGPGGWALALAGSRRYVASYRQVLDHWRDPLSSSVQEAAAAGAEGGAVARQDGAPNRRGKRCKASSPSSRKGGAAPGEGEAGEGVGLGDEVGVGEGGPGGVGCADGRGGGGGGGGGVKGGKAGKRSRKA
ncbi:hypothetical protein PLESTF_001939700 [Pleodorina starrii]|nr:hypothetical protein PLESTF_001939700 [Pleodorina starrii]